MPIRNVLLLEPFYGGSHRAFTDGLKRTSRHRVECLTLPDRFWKWRLRGAAIVLADRIASLSVSPDIILASDMLSVADLKALLGSDAPPVLLYMHENQLTFPVPEGARADYQFAFTNVTSCLAADRVLFNSEFHRQDFLDALPGLFKMMPDCRPKKVPERIRAKSEVIPLGCDVSFFGHLRNPRASSGSITIVWNHRWEFDKVPEVFFEMMYRLQGDMLPFKLIVCGESSQVKPKVFLEARRRLGRRVVHFGYEPSRARYARLLGQSDVVVSTAIQENFGLSVIEAVVAGCYPLLPRRLSYPEILPRACHKDHLYEDEEELYRRLRGILKNGLPSGFDRERLLEHFSRYDWEAVAPLYDDLLDRLADVRSARYKRGT